MTAGLLGGALVLGLLASPAVAATDTQAPQRVAAASRWAPVDQASIHPGVQVVTEGSQCTSNFIFTEGDDVLIGMAAHCAGNGGSSGVNGCEEPSHPIGTLVAIDGAQWAGTLVYSSWLTMQERGETNSDLCNYNDFALVRIAAQDEDRVNPSVPEYGGPLGVSDGTTSGATVYTYGNSSARNSPSARPGNVTSVGGGGLTYDVRHTFDPGIPGDSGSPYLDERGRAVGVLSTIEVFPNIASNGVSDLASMLAYMATATGRTPELALSTVAFGPTGEEPPSDPADPDPDPPAVRITRLQGPDRYATAAAVAATFTSADAIVVATGTSPADALAAGPAAAALGAPLLLSSGAGLTQATLDQVTRLQPSTAWIVGGTNAVPAATVTQLRNAGVDVVTRIAGTDRYATAAAVAEQFGDDGDAIVVASGLGFADALAASPLAAARDGWLLLTHPDRLPTATRDLLAESGPSSITVTGGTAVVPQARLEDMRAASGTTPTRIAGTNRYDTAVAVARAVHATPGVDDSTITWIASGSAFPDAVAGGPAVAATGGGLVLVPPTGALPSSVERFVADVGTTEVVVLGGTGAVSEPMARNVAAAAAD